MKTVKFLLAWLAVTFLLLFAVVLTDTVYSLWKQDISVPAGMYPLKDMLLGIASESLRALLLCYLFPKIRGAADSVANAIKFGLVISGLIASMWLIIGYGSFQLKDPGKFVMYDGVILVLQGVFSGLGLYAACKRRYLS